jgi:hypothetical protein
VQGAFRQPKDYKHTLSRHLYFKVGSNDKLMALQQRVWDYYKRGREGALREADKPGEKDSRAVGVEYPIRFFDRDFAGNRLQFQTCQQSDQPAFRV